MRKRKPATHYKLACKLVGVDPHKVQFAGPTAVKQVTGSGVGGYDGLAFHKYNLIYVRRTAAFEVYVHELLHLLFPSHPHWWIYAAAYTLAGQTKTTWQLPPRLQRSPEMFQLPSRQQLRKLAHQAARLRGLHPDEEDSTSGQAIRADQKR